MPKPNKKSVLTRSLRALVLIAVGFSLPLAAYLVYLDRVVVNAFEGKRFALPAKVYARPLELYKGKVLTAAILEHELSFLQYQKAQGALQAGQYQRRGSRFDIMVRPFSFWDGKQEAASISVAINSDRISELRKLDSQQPVNLWRLEPAAIGGIYPNKGEDRELVRLEQVPDILLQTLIAVEDKRFYQHHGVDPKAVLRALTTVFNGGRVQGGSTITQQLVKNFFLTRERTVSRKLKEMMMALLLELHFSKADILETYLNEVYFGQDGNRAIHGIGLASQFYFSHTVEHIQLEQAALLVGMLKGPAYYNPRRSPQRAKQRRDLVLNLLEEQGVINTQMASLAKRVPLNISPLANLGQSRFPAFMDLVIRQLKRDYRDKDLRSEGLRIFTTLDPFEQHSAENALSEQLPRLERQRSLPAGHLEGAVILANVHDGEVKAVVGGRKTQYQGFNRALDASRQIGSLIKPAIYLTALANPAQYHLASPLDDSPFTWEEPGIEPWTPQNYDREFHGEVPLWRALAESYNVAAARLGTELGVHNVMATAKRLGVNAELPNYASGLLGTIHLSPYEVAQMYHTFATGGFKTPFRAIREVTTKDGEPLNRYPLDVSAAVPPIANYLTVTAMQKVVSDGTGQGLSHYLPRTLNTAGKTGTTDELRDSWFAGFTGDRIAVVWLGNDDNQSIKLTGASGALGVWGRLMGSLPTQALTLPLPEKVDMVAVDRESGFIAIDDCHNTFALPFHEQSLPDDQPYCSAKPRSKIKSWIKGLFGAE